MPVKGVGNNEKLKKLRRLLQRKRHFELELWSRSSVLRLFLVGHVLGNGWSVLSLYWHERFHRNSEKERLPSVGSLTLSSEPHKRTSEVITAPAMKTRQIDDMIGWGKIIVRHAFWCNVLTYSVRRRRDIFIFVVPTTRPAHMQE